MTKELYWEQFLTARKTVNFYNLLRVPDDNLAHKGIYRLVPLEQESTIDSSRIVDDEFIIFDYNTKTKTEKAIRFNKVNFFDFIFNEIHSKLDNNEKTIKLFSRHRIHPLEYNSLIRVKAEPFIKNEVKKINVKLNVFDIKYMPEKCILVLSVENENETKFRKEKIISSDEEISESIIIPENTLDTDLIKVYVWQSLDNRIVFRISNLRLDIEK